MSVSLGWKPIPLTVVLARGGDFVASLELEGGETWPDGTVIDLLFTVTQTSTPIVWSASIDSAVATWDVDATDVAEVLDAHALRARVRLTYSDGTEIIWMAGRVTGEC